MFITNFSLDLYSQAFTLIILTIAGIALLISLYILIIKKIEESLIFSILFFTCFFVIFPFALKRDYYKLTIAYVNIDDNNNKTMTKDIAINTLLNDGIYPKYNAKYKTSKETFKLTKEEYEKLSEIYYDDLNNRR